MKAWIKLPEVVRELYSRILRQDLKKTEEHLVHSWRYHITFLKVLETVIDSQVEYNEQFSAYINSMKNELNPEKQKLYQEFSFYNKQFSSMIQNERKEAIKIFTTILQERTSSNPARKYSCKVIAHLVSRFRLQKVRQMALENLMKLGKSKTLYLKQTFLQVVHELIDSELISSHTF